MKYAIIAVVVTCWTLLAFLYRVAAKRDAARNYVSAAAAVVWLLLLIGLAAAKGVDIVHAPRGLFAAGLLGGISLAAALPLFMCAVARGNLAVSWTLLTLSFAAASLASMIYPGAPASTMGVCGFAAAACAIILLGYDSAALGAKGGFRRGWGLYMFLAFAANGMAMYVFTLANKWGDTGPLAHKMAFFISQTVVFFVGSAVLAATGGKVSGKARAIAIGAGVGALLAVGNYAVLVALSDMEVAPYVLFPATTGGSTLTVALISAVLIGERPGRWGWAGLVLGLAAMVLLGASA